MDEYERFEVKLDKLETKVDKIEKLIDRSEHWRIGNGTKQNSADYRLNWIMNNAVTRQNIHTIVHDVVKQVTKEKSREGRADWNKWVNTGLLIIAIIGIYLQMGGG